MATTVRSASDKRSYSSTLRQHQSELTKELIIRALNELVAENKILSFTMEDVAERAGVSLRSVYRHYPSRESLIEALYISNEELLNPFIAIDLPVSAEGIPGLAEQVFANFDKHRIVARALSITSIVSGVRPGKRKERDEILINLLAEVTSNLGQDERCRAFAVIRYYLSILGWQTLQDRFGLEGSEAGKAAAWALDVLIRDLKKRNAEAGKVLKEGGRG